MLEMEEKFPVGMRVLAVDDDSTCLFILATMLRKCQYNVTTTKEAIKALQILRENNNEFDLVISNIEMPNMNGFELLYQVGLQMDIPVLLLSAHDDKEWVMKGLAHGACHYLFKPVRIEELRNIWQHVFRRKLASGSGKPPRVLLKGTQNVDHKPNKKRKDENNQDGGDQSEDSSSTSQKKARVVWFPELHQKFLAAVDQLGVDKAVPKRILELMNDENLTRENVASHLQKHRMFLKKRNSLPSLQANMFAAYGSGGRSAYGQLVPRVNNTHMMVEAAAGYTSSLGGLCSVSSSGNLQWAQPDNLVSIHRQHNVHPSIQPMKNRRWDLPHGRLSIAMEFDNGNGQRDKDITPIAEFPSINFGDAAVRDDFSVCVNCDYADNDLMLAPQQEFCRYLSTDGYDDNLPSVIQHENFYEEHNLSPYNGATTSAAHLVAKSVVNITDLQRREHPSSQTHK